jgi:hypothetical protein
VGHVSDVSVSFGTIQTVLSNSRDNEVTTRIAKSITSALAASHRTVQNGVKDRTIQRDTSMADEFQLPTEDELAKLPHWVVTAYAARCACRVMPLFRLPQTVAIAERQKHSQTLELAMRTLREELPLPDYAKKVFASHAAADSVKEIASSWAANAMQAALAAASDINPVDFSKSSGAAAWSSVQAANAWDMVTNSGDSPLKQQSSETVRSAAASDYIWLSGLTAKSRPMRKLLDARPLWPSGPPDWYPQALEEFESLIRKSVSTDDAMTLSMYGPSGAGKSASVSAILPARPMTVYVDAGAADAETVRDLFLALSAVYESQGGSGLRIVRHSQGTLVGEEVPV